MVVRDRSGGGTGSHPDLGEYNVPLADVQQGAGRTKRGVQVSMVPDGTNVKGPRGCSLAASLVQLCVGTTICYCRRRLVQYWNDFYRRRPTAQSQPLTTPRWMRVATKSRTYFGFLYEDIRADVLGFFMNPGAVNHGAVAGGGRS